MVNVRLSRSKCKKKEECQRYLDSIFQPLVQVGVLAPVVNQQVGATDDVRRASRSRDKELSPDIKTLYFTYLIRTTYIHYFAKLCSFSTNLMKLKNAIALQ